MKAIALRIMCLVLCLATVAAVSAQTPPAGTPRPGVPAVPPPGPRDDHRGVNASRPMNGSKTDRSSRSHNGLQFGPVGRWWDNKSVVSNIGITHDQQKKMDGIFDANRSTIVSSYKAYLKAQEHLDALNKSANPDQSQVFSAIDSVNQARSDMQKAASAMLLQIRKEMSADQIDKLSKLQ